MKTKKILSFVLAAVMMLSMATTSFAVEVTSNGGSGETVVTYGMDEGFTVTIPANFTIDSTKKATADVSASNVMIAHGKVLEVTVSGDDYDVTGSWELIDEAEASNKLTYTIGTTEGGTDIVNNSVVLSVGAGEAYSSTVTETMHFTVIDELSKAGTYKDTLTFTVGVNGLELISFTILGYDESSMFIPTTTYQAEKGMTWAEWINSPYNTDGYYVSDWNSVMEGTYRKLSVGSVENVNVPGSGVWVWNANTEIILSELTYMLGTMA